MSLAAQIAQTLERDGIAIWPERVAPDLLSVLQQSFTQRLSHRVWNTWRGFEQNELYRRLVEDVMMVSPGFARVGLAPDILDTLDLYLQPGYVMTEARGWRTIKTRRNFHGWHVDAWYDRALPVIPRQVKLGLYLSDVRSGQFRYLKQSHVSGQPPSAQPANHWNDAEVAAKGGEIVDCYGPAGTMILFDTSGIHRQSSPVLDDRDIVFFNYHHPGTPLQQLDVIYGRYAPLAMTPDVLSGCDTRQLQVLGMRDTPVALSVATPPKQRFARLHRAYDGLFGLWLRIEDIRFRLRQLWLSLARRVPF